MNSSSRDHAPTTSAATRDPIARAASFTWTAARQAELEASAAKGWTAAQVGESFRISRDAILGRARRTGVRFLNGRGLASVMGATTASIRPRVLAYAEKFGVDAARGLLGQILEELGAS